MSKLDVKRAAWYRLCDAVGASSRSYGADGASLFVGYISIATLEELDEDVEATADEVYAGLVDALSAAGSPPELGVSASIRSDGDKLGIAMNVMPSKHGDQEFVELCNLLTDALVEFLS